MVWSSPARRAGLALNSDSASRLGQAARGGSRWCLEHLQGWGFYSFSGQLQNEISASGNYQFPGSMLVKPTLHRFQEGWGTRAVSPWLKKRGQGPVPVPGCSEAGGWHPCGTGLAATGAGGLKPCIGWSLALALFWALCGPEAH